MLNKLSQALGELTAPGDTLVCALSGGADSVALLFGAFLLADKLGLNVRAAHFNHHLRGAESDADEAFVRSFCLGYGIPLTLGGGLVEPGKKGLEAAAREARYDFLRTLPGKIATAHTADDNAETVLMHLLRGTGLKGLGGIAPVNGRVIRPMLSITRQEVEAFLDEYHLPHREDSSNAGDTFLRNRLRHRVVPLLKAENPSFSLGVSAMARRLREDEAYLQAQLEPEMPGVGVLRSMPQALQSRYLERFLKESGIREPEQAHIAAARGLLDSPKPSARMNFPGSITIARDYDRLRVQPHCPLPAPQPLAVPGQTVLEDWGIRVRVDSAANGGFGVRIQGTLTVRSRRPGDTIRLSGGTKTIKKLMIDEKISAQKRDFIPILADDLGVLWVGGFGANLSRLEQSPSHYVLIQQL